MKTLISQIGGAKITKGYHLPCKYVIHAVGPRWRDGTHQEQELLFDRKAYQISEKLFADIEAYIDDRYAEEHIDSRAEQSRRLETLAEANRDRFYP